MGSLYRVVRPDGSVEYTDAPSGAGRIEPIRPGQTRPDGAREQRESQPYDPKLARELIKETQKRVPKVIDYLDYLDYLRHNSPVRFDRVMAELKQQDPQTWLKLQKYPQFRPLRETAIGLKAGEKSLSAGIGLATGSFTGSAEKWMETTLKDLMKRDRFGPYADVLGSKGPMSLPKPTYYSNSRMGEYLKGQDVLAEAAAKATARELDSAKAGLRAAKGAVAGKIGGPLIDLGIGLLDPAKAEGIGAKQLRDRAERLFNSGVFDAEEWDQAQTLHGQRRYIEMQKFMDEAVQRYVKK